MIAFLLYYCDTVYTTGRIFRVWAQCRSMPYDIWHMKRALIVVTCRTWIVTYEKFHTWTVRTTVYLTPVCISYKNWSISKYQRFWQKRSMKLKVINDKFRCLRLSSKTSVAEQLIVTLRWQGNGRLSASTEYSSPKSLKHVLLETTSKKQHQNVAGICEVHGLHCTSAMLLRPMLR